MKENKDLIIREAKRTLSLITFNDGSCLRISYNFCRYMKEVYEIELDLIGGGIDDGKTYGEHVWCMYHNEVIDLTSDKQNCAIPVSIFGKTNKKRTRINENKKLVGDFRREMKELGIPRRSLIGVILKAQNDGFLSKDLDVLPKGTDLYYGDFKEAMLDNNSIILGEFREQKTLYGSNL